MKKSVLLILSAALMLSACDNKPEITTADIEIALQNNGEPFAQDGINVIIKETASGTTFNALTDENGIAKFTLSSGIYEGSATWKTSAEGIQTIYNGINSNIVVSAGKNETFPLELKTSQASQIIIKELYTTGCQGVDPKKPFSNDAYVILYNNSDQEADASDVCFAFCNPFNSYQTNKYLTDGKLFFEELGWLPSGYSAWWFQKEVKIAPYSQIIVAIKGAIDNTVTYPESVDLSHADYYMYDPESGFNNASAYPAPLESMPADHYLKTFVISKGNAWPISNSSPAFYIFKNANIEAFSKDENNYDRTENAKLPVLKIPMSSVIDAVEVFDFTNKEKNAKRFPSSIDAGYVEIISKNGHTIYRNVDKEATEALAENEGKLVYDYAGGTLDIEGTTDPSGIDAEASIAKGAHIIYKDTNNSSNDFHQRNKASIKK